MCITESLCCTAEVNTTLYINCIPIKKNYFCFNMCSRTLCPCQTVFTSAKMIILSLFKFFSPSVNILEYIIFMHICKPTRESNGVRQWMFKKVTKNKGPWKDILKFQMWISLTFGQGCKFTSVVNYSVL